MADARVVRTLSLVGADGAGKTALAEALIRFAEPRHAHPSGSTARLDADPEEKKRNFSLGLHPMSFDAGDRTFHVLDCPGFSSFLPDVERALHVTDGTVFVVSAAAGAHHAAERLFDAVAASRHPAIGVLSRLDHERADFDATLADIESALKIRPVPVQLPVRIGRALHGVVDLPTLRLHTARGAFGAYVEEELHAGVLETATAARATLAEAAAEHDDALLERYLEVGDLTAEEIHRGLAAGARAGAILPVACVAARAGVGIAELLDAIVALLPGPREAVGRTAAGAEVVRPASAVVPLTAQVLRTTIDPFAGRVNVVRVFSGTLKPDLPAVNSRTGAEARFAHLYRSDGGQLTEVPSAGPGDLVVVQKTRDLATGDTISAGPDPVTLPDLAPPSRRAAAALQSKAPDEKVATALHKLVEEDPSLEVVQVNGETLLRGMGQAHLELVVERLRRKHGIEVTLGPPTPAWCETISRPARAQGRHKKQTGGHGQFADCHVELSPLPRGAGFQFEDAIVGGAIPRQWIPSVEKGIRGALAHGPLGGFPVVDLAAKLYLGAYHDVDSSDMAFQIAGSLAFRIAVREAAPILLEPIFQLEVIVPEDAIGPVLGDLSRRRARVHGQEPLARGVLVRAHAPHLEVLTYDADLRSLTQGVGTFTMAFAHYEPAPPDVTKRVVAQRVAEGKVKGLEA